MRLPTLPLLLLLGDVGAGAALAGVGPDRQDLRAYKPGTASEGARPPRGAMHSYQPADQTQEEQRAAEIKARYKVGAWREGESVPPPAEFPWLFLGFTLLIFAVVSPFAWSAFRRHVTEEMTQASRAAPRRRRPPAS